VGGFDDRVGRRRQEAVDKVGAGDGFRLGAAVSAEFGPDAGEGEQRTVVIECEPPRPFCSLADPADYQAQVDQAEAGVVGAQAALDNLSNQVELQYATIAQAEAQLVSAQAQEVEAREERDRQQSLTQTEAGTRQKLEQATAGYARAQADVQANRALIAAQRHQLGVLSRTKKQRAADLEGAKATRAAARLRLGYTRIMAPFDGVVGEREVQPGDYVNIGSNLINVVPLRCCRDLKSTAQS
jgi:multidrug resistance efflux pump